jgi:hypothetical protein
VVWAATEQQILTVAMVQRFFSLFLCLCYNIVFGDSVSCAAFFFVLSQCRIFLVQPQCSVQFFSLCCLSAACFFSAATVQCVFFVQPEGGMFGFFALCCLSAACFLCAAAGHGFVLFLFFDFCATTGQHGFCAAAVQRVFCPAAAAVLQYPLFFFAMSDEGFFVVVVCICFL